MKIISNKIFREKAVYEPILNQPIKDSSGKDLYFISSDLVLLFNQERLNALGDSALLEYVNSLTSTNDTLSELRKNCSDSELLSIIKSRHIQSRSELLAWSNYLSYQLDDYKKELDNIRKNSENTIKFNESDVNNENT